MKSMRWSSTSGLTSPLQAIDGTSMNMLLPDVGTGDATALFVTPMVETTKPKPDEE